MVGQTEVCTECNTAGQVPINGTCTAKTENTVTAAGCKQTSGTDLAGTEKVCGQCDAANYFLYKGGCYSTDDATGQKLCTGAPAGICTTAASGYFVPPGAQKAAQSVISCSEQATIAVNNKNFRGVTNCLVCDAPTATTADPNLPTCTTCEEGYFGASCQQCNDHTNCATCSDGEANHCTKCKTDKYLTTTGTCVAACTEGTQFSIGTAESGKKCFACGDTTNGVDGCEKCTAPGEGKPKPTCTKCSAKYLKTVSGVTTCETDCGEGYFKNDKGGSDSQTKVCVSCGDATSGVPNCVKCTAPSQEGQKPACSECGSGFKLEGGACVSTGGPNLSPGAIAGSSVAAVVVVGGLVGFLCWWFICRGKA